MSKKAIGIVVECIEGVVDPLGRIGSWFALLMVLVMFLIVVLRYVFQIGSIALQESIMYINALIFVCGVAYTLKEGGHVRVDVFYGQLSNRAKALIDIFGNLVFLGLTTGFIFWASWDYVSVSWLVREGSAESSGLPFVYLLKTAILAIPLLLIFQGIAEFFKSYNKFRQG